MSETTTTNMGMLLAAVSETLGPRWAQLINDALNIVDLHDHSSGSGAQVTPAGMLINDDLDMDGNRLLNVLLAGLSNIGTIDLTKTGSIQRVGTNLWWVNAAGAAVQITNGTQVVSTGTGALTIGVPGAYPYTVLSSDAQKVLVIDTSAARTINLPAATTSMYVVLKDGGGSAATNNISVVPAGTDTIDGDNATYPIGANNESVGFISDGVSKWYAI